MLEKSRTQNLSVEEVKDPNSPEFRRAIEIYKSSFHGEIAEDPGVMAKALNYTNMPKYAKNLARKGRPEDFHMIVVKDSSVKGSETDKIIGMQTFSYYPDKNFAVGWYLCVESTHRGKLTGKFTTETAKKKVEEFAARYGQKPLGMFGEIELTNTKMSGAMDRYKMQKVGVNYLCQPFRKGESPTPANLFFQQMGNKSAYQMTPQEKADVVRTIYDRGYGVKNVDKDPVFQQVLQSIGIREKAATKSAYQPRRIAVPV